MKPNRSVVFTAITKQYEGFFASDRLFGMTGEEEVFFVARVARSIDRLEDAARIICDIAASGAKMTSEYQAFFSNVYDTIFQSKARDLRCISEALTKPRISSKCQKALISLQTQIRVDLFKTYSEFVKVTKTFFLVESEDMKQCVKLHKQIGDVFRKIEDCFPKVAQTDAVNQVVMSYETAVRMAAKEFGPLNVDYLKCVLNWTGFQYRYTSEPRKALALLYTTYSETMKNIGNVPPEEYPEVWAVLELMERNMGCWGDHEEETEEELES
jgi:hypothetical protein